MCVRRLGERGQALPLVILVVVLCGAMVVGLGRLGQVAAARAQAQTAADGAALAGAAEGQAAAERVAQANEGRVVAYRARGREVEVEVVVGPARARARARAPAGR